MPLFFLRQELGEDSRKYVDIMQRVADRQETVVEVELDDVLAVSFFLLGGLAGGGGGGRGTHMLLALYSFEY